MKKQLARPKYTTGNKVKYHRLVWTIGNVMEEPDGEIVYHLYRFHKGGILDEYVPEFLL